MLLVACVALIAASAALMAVLYVPGRDPSRVYYGTDTRAQSLLIGAVVGILLFHARTDPIAGTDGWRCASPRWSAPVYTLWLFWRMSERTDALYQGGFLLAALAVSAVIVSVVQPDRGVLGRALSFAPCDGWGASPTGSTCGTGRCTSRSRSTRTGLDGFCAARCAARR